MTVHQVRYDPARRALRIGEGHDEVIVHCQERLADVVIAAATKAAKDAARQVFGVTQVVFPLTTAVVTCYGDAK